MALVCLEALATYAFSTDDCYDDSGNYFSCKEKAQQIEEFHESEKVLKSLNLSPANEARKLESARKHYGLTKEELAFSEKTP